MKLSRPYHFLGAALVVLLWVPFTGMAQVMPVHAANLRCGMRQDPLGIDVLHPRFSWELYGRGRDIRQTAYQLLVATSPGLLDERKADLWNSGKVASDH